LYAEYRAFSRPKGVPRFPTVEGELDALLRFTAPYSLLEQPNADSSIGRLGTKLNLWEVTTVYPLIFCIAIADVDEVAKDQLYRLVYSYLVRRAICGLTPKNLNKTFQRMVSIFLESGVSLESLATAFSDQTGPAVRFPADDEFEAAIREKPVYEMILKKERLIDILWELELRLRDKFSVATPRPNGISIEHILPQRWAKNWILPDGRKAPPDFVTGADETMLVSIAARNGVLHTLGNLTLITVPGNSAASNSAFAEKKQWLKKSLLALNLAIVEDRQSWDLLEINDRAIALSSLAKLIWPSLTAKHVAGM
jgi:hypothetical protein